MPQIFSKMFRKYYFILKKNVKVFLFYIEKYRFSHLLSESETLYYPIFR